jgi:hypothetical protein
MKRSFVHSDLTRLTYLVFTLGLAACAFVPFALPSSANAQDAAATGVHFWYEGDVRHEVHLRSGLLAEFGSPANNGMASGMTGGMTSPTSLQKAGVGSVIKQAGATKIYKISNPLAVQKLTATGTQQNLSPVFSDSANGATLRALPGGIIVTFNELQSEQWVRDWAAANQLVFDRILPNSRQTIAVFKTSAGLESLTTANRVRQIEGVQAARPDWWTEKWKDDLQTPALTPQQVQQHQNSRRKSTERFGRSKL